MGTKQKHKAYKVHEEYLDEQEEVIVWADSDKEAKKLGYSKLEEVREYINLRVRRAGYMDGLSHLSRYEKQRKLLENGWVLCLEGKYYDIDNIKEFDKDYKGK